MVERLLPQQAVIYTTTMSNVWGIETPVQTIRCTAKCRLDMMRSSPPGVWDYERRVVTNRYELYLPIGTKIEKNDTVSIGSMTYNVDMVFEQYGRRTPSHLYCQLSIIS
jgi:hypothetical protein